MGTRRWVKELEKWIRRSGSSKEAVAQRSRTFKKLASAVGGGLVGAAVTVAVLKRRKD